MSARYVIGIAGWKNSGKTGLTERLVTELISRGRTVSTVKRAHHEADVDHPGTDSYRHRQAGAGEVLLVTPRRWALMHEMRDEAEPDLDAMLAMLALCDIVLVEGYKTGSHPKIEVRRLEAKERTPLPASANVIAIAADHQVVDAAVPVFDLDAVAPIADFIEAAAGLR
jgi:molybdopterin-guanine dinucleotide biosynthesis protein B